MEVLLRILRFTIAHKRRLTLAYLVSGGGIAAYVALPKLFGSAIDRVDMGLQTGTISDSAILQIALAITGLGVVRGVLSFGQTYLSESLAQEVVYNIRNRFYDHVQHLSFAFHDKQHTGNLMSRAITDIEAIRMFVNLTVVRAPYFLLLIATVSVMMLHLDLQLGLIGLVLLPFVLIFASIVRVRMRFAWLKVQATFGELNTILQENLSGVRVVKAFGASDFEQKKFDRNSSKLSEQMFKAIQLEALNGSTVLTAFLVTIGFVLLFGGMRVIDGTLTPGVLAQMIFFLQLLSQPVRISGAIVNNMARAMSAGGRLFEIMNARSDVEESNRALVLPRVRGHVRFHSVGFEYKPQTPVITDLDLDIAPGKIVALLGPPGSGKTTIANLIPRFYDVKRGRITIDGTDLRKATLKSLRANVGMVQQDVFLFSDTIAQNIAYGRPEATMDEIIHASEIAQLHEHIASLPDGYETILGERGITLSGGQRQRLSIARAILLDPPILILDDSTSSVDSKTEYEIRKAMETVMEGRTTFVIANRLSTVHKADTIVVLNAGTIVEQGAHQELLAKGGLYREIYDLQLRPQEEVMMEFDVSDDLVAEKIV